MTVVNGSFRTKVPTAKNRIGINNKSEPIAGFMPSRHASTNPALNTIKMKMKNEIPGALFQNKKSKHQATKKDPPRMIFGFFTTTTSYSKLVGHSKQFSQSKGVRELSKTILIKEIK